MSGMGVMIGMLSGNKESVDAVKAVIGKTIRSITVTDDELVIAFENAPKLKVWDGGQSCCESRYMQTDDVLDNFVGGTLQEMEIRTAEEAPEEEDTYGEHEIQFLVVTTSKGVFTVANHNEHNGYYGGFWMQAKLETA